ncbi:hypothetical protein S7711_03419 [Stachybotrys chartarum IBT 7711]|uniref:Sulfatase-modifying factor enzyme-like domain-containing protein n=1 Tax=Stachybotrys chartarum (strain CBS 109288 / IBT 7711) TaxID=1280523 RepID=A0A084AY21_STACB|nr:hypothetical protein S7711_03419 [Stachybotrys chartarum IBT 7711]KFA46162.1 hypothetical protein S40293_03798 [Stachybotrys chartarum IBT 40293]
MLKYAAHPVVRSMLLAPLGLALAASPSADDVRSDLLALADVLRWQGSMGATYGAILDQATDAYATVSSVSEDSSFAPQAQLVREKLELLLVESQHFVDEASDPEYVLDPLETPEYLTANVDEWSYAVAVMSENLEEPICEVVADAAPVRALNITSATTAGTEFQDAETLPVMVIIPTGSYTAGATPEEHDLWGVPEEKRYFERPQRQVTISTPLAFSRTEVTVGQFREFIESTCYQTRGGARWWDIDAVDNFVFNAALTWDDPGFPQTDDHPVVAVTRYDAEAYAEWLSQITGATYRLPNEDEWEWAARGGTQDIFFWGDELLDAVDYANTYDLTASRINQFRWPPINIDDHFPHTAPVASFQPNGYGLYDVTANAREFMADDWQGDLTNAASDGSRHVGPAPFPTVRGGAWNYNPRNLRLNYRSGYLSSEVATNMFGIRLVREL